MTRPFATIAASVTATLALAGTAIAGVGIALDSPRDLDGSGSYVWAHAFAAHLEAEGMAPETFEVGALGGDDELFDQISQGLLEVSMSPLNIVGSLDTTIFGLRLPYFFEDIADVDRALHDGGMLARINEGTTPNGVRVLAVPTVGPATGIFNTQHPVESLADMQGLRMRALDQTQIDLFRAWGATGTIVSWAEVPNALQTGVADGYLNPAFVPLLFGHTDFIEHFTDAAISPSLRIVIASENWYQGLGDDERAIIDSAVVEANAANRAWLQTQGALLDDLRDAGVAVVELSDEAREEFQRASEATYTDGTLTPEQIAEWEAALE